MHMDICGSGFDGVCPGMDPIDGELLKDYLLKVMFEG